MIDKRLIYIQSYLSGEHEESLHEFIGISRRQLSRLLNTWQDEGWLEYTSGSGRGNKLDITLKVDAEKELFYHAIRNAKHMELSELQEYINLPWHEESKASVVEAINNEFYQDNSGGFLLDYVYDLPKKLYTHMPHDSVSYQIFDQIAEALYECKGDRLDYVLVRFDEWIDNDLHIHITKDAYFDDNVQLTTKHVQPILEHLCESSVYKRHFKLIESIEVVNDFYLILHCARRADHLRLLLSQPISLITRDSGGRVHGTGKYHIHQHNDSEIILAANPYHKRQPQVQKIFLLRNKRKTREDYSKLNRKYSIRFNLSNALLVCNPESDLSKEERMIFRDAFLYYFKELIDEEQMEYSWLTKMPELMKEKQQLSRPVKFISNEYNYEAFQTIFDKMSEDLDIQVEHQRMEHIEYLETDLKELNVDFILMIESFMNEQPYMLYELLMHCKCKEWFENQAEFNAFVEDFDLYKIDDMREKSEKLVSNIENDGYFTNIYLKYKYFYFPSYVHFVEVNKYGYIDYGSTVVE